MAGEIAQQLRTLTTIPEDSFIPNTHCGGLQISITPVLGIR